MLSKSLAKLKHLLIGITLAGLVALTFAAAPEQAVASSLYGAALHATESLSAAASVVITKQPGTVKRGNYASIAAKTQARVSCAITVTYKSGRSTAAGLTRKAASSTGAVSWSWKVGTNTTPGSWPVVITCGGATARTVVNVVR